MALSIVYLLLLLGCAALTAWRLERYLGVASSTSSRAVTVVILAVSQVELVSIAMGLVGLLSRVAILSTDALLAVVAATLPAGRKSVLPAAPSVRPPHSASRVTRIICLGVIAYTVVRWTATTFFVTTVGFQDFDTLGYHLSTAARFAQLHDLYHLQLVYPETAITFYPLNVELLYSTILSVTQSDVWIVFFNLGCLALLLVAAWAIGRRYGVAHLATAAVAAVAATPLLVASYPGTAMDDLFATSMLVGGLALLISEGFSPSTLAVGGLAAGLAAGAKFTMLPPVVALCVAILIWLWRTGRAAQIWFWAVGLVATGSFWYLRNLVGTGSPLPVAHLAVGGIGFPAAKITSPDGFSVLHYATDVRVLKEIVSNLDADFGSLNYAVLGLLLIGIVGALLRPVDGWVRVTGLVGLVAGLSYLATPQTAWGPEGHPEGMQVTDYNVRYALTALVLGFLLVAVLPLITRTGAQVGLAGLLAAITAVNITPPSSVPTLVTYLPVPLVPGLAAAALGVLAWWCAGRMPAARRRMAGASFSCMGAVVALLLSPVLGREWHHRYVPVDGATSGDIGLYRWAAGISHARIGVVGLMQYYPLYGNGFTNRVSYVGWVGAHDAFHDFQTCPALLQALRAGRYDYLVAESYDPPYAAPPPVATWLKDMVGVTPQLVDNNKSVYRLSPALDPRSCPTTATNLARDAVPKAAGGARAAA